MHASTMELRAKGVNTKGRLEICKASTTVLTAAIAATWGLFIVFIVLSYAGETTEMYALI